MKSGGDTRVRTEDLIHAMDALYQLSYIPTRMTDWAELLPIDPKIKMRFGSALGSYLSPWLARLTGRLQASAEAVPVRAD